MANPFHTQDRLTSFRRSRKRSLFFEPMEQRLNLSVMFLESEPANDTSPGQQIVHPGLTSGVVDSWTPGSGGSVAAITDGDADFYNFTAAVPGELVIALADLGGDPSGDGTGEDSLQVTVRDNSNAIIATATLPGSGSTFSFTTVAANTTDVFKVEVAPSFPTEDAFYQLRVRNVDVDDVGGNDNTRATANDLGDLNGPITVSDHTITRPDRDYFKITSQITGPVEVHLVMPPGTGMNGGPNGPTNLGLRVRDDAGAIIATSNAAMTAEDLATFQATADEMYFIEVYSSSLGQVNVYDLQLTTPPPPTGDLSGFKYSDLNADGFQDLNEPGLQNWVIYSDANNDGILNNAVSGAGVCDANASEPCDITDGNGFYELLGLPAGINHIREVPQPGWALIYPGAEDNGHYLLNILADTTLDHIDFGNFETITISGRKFEDLNGGGSGAGDPGLGGWTIFLDTNNNGVLDGSEASTVTAGGTGAYQFADLGPGTYTVREVNQSGWTQTTANPATITAVSGTDVAGVDFGNFQNAQVSGMKFNDLNGNGVKDAGEPGLQNWTIFDDDNGNGLLDAGEASKLTDVNGNYSFTAGPNTTLTLHEVGQANWTQTTANPAPITPTSGQTVSNVDFGNFQNAQVSGMKFNDLNGNGVKDAGEPGLQNWTIFDDDNGNGLLDAGEASKLTDVNGNYSFTVGPNTTLTLHEVGQAGWTQTTANPAPITPTSGQTVSNVSFGNFADAVVSGMKFNDLNGNGIKDAGEPGLQNWTIFDDDNGNGLLDAGEASKLTDVNGNYSFTVGPNTTLTLHEVGQANWTQTTANPAPITPTSGQTVSNVDFGNFQNAQVSGMKFNDLNGNGVKDAGEPGLQNWTIFDDDNGNGLLDAGEASKLTDVNGNYSFIVGPNTTLTLHEVGQANWTQTTANPAPITPTSGQVISNVDFGNFQGAVVSGMKFNDTNGNGVKDAGEPGLQNWTIFDDDNGNGLLDAGEANRVTDVNGNYSFTVGPNTTLTLREVLQAGWTKITINPADITPTSGQVVSNVDFGNFQNAAVSGMKFDDTNGNGVKDAGEPGLQNWTIFDDDNGNSVLDAGEASRVTDVNGNYSFTVGPNTTLTLHEVGKPGWVQTTTNPAPITPTSGQVVGNVNFGNFKLISISGTKYNDLNGNGVREGGEPGLANWTIYLDDNNNGVLDVGEANDLTDANGAYSFSNLGPGIYRVREVPQPNFGQSSGLINIPAISGVDVLNADLGNVQGAMIQGMKFEDVNGNGVKEPGELGLANWTIFLDGNGNGVFDGGEASRVTDANGNYLFDNLAPGTYRVREVGQAGWIQTTADPAPSVISSGTAITENFGNFKLGSITVVKDANPDSSTDFTFTGDLGNFTLDDDTDNTWPNSLLFPNLTAGTYSITENLIGGWELTNIVASDGSTVNIGTRTATIVVTSGEDITVTFVNEVVPAFRGMKFFDHDGQGDKDAGDEGLANWRIELFQDDGDGIFEPGPFGLQVPDGPGTTGGDMLVDWDLTDALGNYRLGDPSLPSGAYFIREIQQQGWGQTTPPGTATNELVHQVNYTTGTSISSGIDFGNRTCDVLAAAGATTLQVASVNPGILTIVFPTAFSVVQSNGLSFSSFNNATGGLVTGSGAINSYADAASGLQRVDIKVSGPTPFDVTVGAAGTLRYTNAVNVTTGASLDLVVTGSDCGETIVVGDDNNDDGTERDGTSDAKAIFIGTHSEPIQDGTVLSGQGILYRTPVIDAIFGSPTIARVVINGKGGDDVIRVTSDITLQQTVLDGGSGNDTIYAGANKSTVYGGAGHDFLVGGAGDDFISGDAGDDALFGGRGSDKIYGGDGNDWIAGGDGDDPLLRGGNGDDVISGGGGQDRLLGDLGFDTLYRDNVDLLVSGEVVNTVAPAADVVDQALLGLLGKIWNDRFSTDKVDNNRDGILDNELDQDLLVDTLDELIAQLLPVPQP